jgi:hypothetical protein
MKIPQAADRIRLSAGRGIVLLALGMTAASPALAQSPVDGRASVPEGLPVLQFFRGFIQNDGQWDSDARFVADFGDLLVRAEPGALVLQKSVPGDEPRLGVVRLVFESGQAEPRRGERAPGEFHYFYGCDPSRWRKHVPAYSDVLYPDAVPGADVRLYRHQGRLEYDVLFPPSAHLESFVVRCEGIDGMSIEANGDLRLDTPLGPIIQSAPAARQMTATGESMSATCSFRLLDGQRFGFAVADRVPDASLLVDPGLTWGTFLGGSAGDSADEVEVLPNGDLLIVGRTSSLDFPTTSGVYATTPAGSIDITITSMQPNGSGLNFSTYLGGSQGDAPGSLSVSTQGLIGIGGYTASTDFPVLPDAWDSSFNGGEFDAVVSVLTPDGSDLVLSTLVGGECNEVFAGVAFARGILVAAGNTCSPSFPVTPSAFDSSYGGQADGIVCWFDSTQSGPGQLVVSTFLGEADTEQIRDLVLRHDSEPIVCGTSSSVDFPVTPGAYDETPGGSFLTRLSVDGSTLVASTHFKGGNPYRLALDGDTVVVAGNPSLTLPVSPNAYDPTWNGFSDCFVARLDDQLSQVLAATYLGGSRDDSWGGLAVDPAGNIVIAGRTQSDNYPTTLGAYDTVKGGPLNSMTSMVSMLSPDLSQLLYSSFLGPAGLQSSWANDVVALGPADVVIVGEGALPGFPVTPGAFDETFNGGTLGTGDGYVARMLLEPLTWYSLGGAVPGSNGTPNLVGSGELVGGQPITLTLTSAKPVTPATLVIGLSPLNAPFKGGTLVPNPALMLFGLPTNAHGSLALSATWPAGLPPGFSFYTQYWIPDAASPAGLAASNGLAGTTP